MASNIQPTSDFDANVKSLDTISLNDKILKPLDEILRCHICFDYFTNCMITKCNHNYCSVCIRRYMSYKSQCPTCFQVATEPELQNNRLIDEILRIYKKIRDASSLLSSYQGRNESLNISPRETIQIPVDSKFPPDASSSSRTVDCDNFEKPSVSETPSHDISKQQNVEESASDEVSCPVCYTTVPSSRINIHLDLCLKQTEERSERKFLPKLVYHLLPDKEIKKILKEHGLSTSGSRQALIRRHKSFIILFNANCDSLNPKPVSELILDIERQELEERVNTSQRSVQVNKKSDPSVIEKEHESYAREHKSQFDALIRDVQERVPELCAIGNKLPSSSTMIVLPTISNIRVQISIKKEDSSTSEETSAITDASGNVIGESTLKVGMSSNTEPVIIKEEFSESLLKDAMPEDSFDRTENEKTGNNEFDDKKKYSENTSQLPFRIKKEVPTVKLKEQPTSLLDKTANQSFASEPSSLDLQTGKMSVNTYPKKKNARRLSTDEKGSQRKK